MRRMARVVLLAVVAAVLAFGPTVGPAVAGGGTIDSYCSPSGDYCTSVREKSDGTIVFQIRGFADYFGRAEACVTKDTRVCRSRRPREAGGLFRWTIRWQGNYPDEGDGRYAVRWLNENDSRIGPVLYFRR